jgi:hypothetical protein
MFRIFFSIAAAAAAAANVFARIFPVCVSAFIILNFERRL